MAAKLKSVRIPRPSRRPKPTDVVYQFLIALAETEPLVWRRIQVPEKYSFWVRIPAIVISPSTPS